MINLEIYFLKLLKCFKKANANNKRSIKLFVNKIIHLKSVSNKKSS